MQKSNNNISNISISERWKTPTKLMQIDDTQSWSEVHKKNIIYKISAQYVKACRIKVRKTVYFMHSRFQKGQCSYKYWRKSTTLKHDLKFIKWKSYTKFQLNISKHVGEKCGRLCISSILTSKRGIAPSKIDAKWWHSNLSWSILKQSHVQNFSTNVKACRRKVWKAVERRPGWTESQPDRQIENRTDGHLFTIIVPSEDGRIILVWFGLLWFNVTFSDRRVYNKNVKS